MLKLPNTITMLAAYIDCVDSEIVDNDSGSSGDDGAYNGKAIIRTMMET